MIVHREQKPEPEMEGSEKARVRRLGSRQRRVLWTSLLLAVLGAGVWLAGWRLYQASRPKLYRPGEESSEITSTVSQRAPGKAGASEPVVRIEPKARKSDPLRNAGQTLPAGAPPPRFTDVTEEAGLGAFRTFAGQRSSQLPEDMGSGAAWGDFDNDGNEDLFLVSAGGPLDAPPEQRAPSALYRNLGDGRFQRVEDFPVTQIIGTGAAWGDYNNDGWLDLVVTGYDTLLLFRNEHGKFVRDRRFAFLKGFWTGAAWGDFDNDGKLDLYVCGYVRYKADRSRAQATSRQFGLEVPFTLNPASFEPERNLLFHNNGDGTFIEVAERLGVANADGRSLSALWHDFDQDGWLDLYVANDVSENKLYLNRHGKFVDAGHSAWVAEYRGSMGLAAGDFDRDGDDDLFISHWVAQQYALYQSLLVEQRIAPGNRKPENRPKTSQLHFTDVAEVRGIGQPSLQSIGWGAAFFDFDSDGWLDLVVANGSTFETKDARRELVPMPSFLFWNDHGQFFHDLAPWNRSLSTPHASRGLAVADYDNDGSLDILIVDHGEGVRLLRNDVPHGNWIEFRLHNRVGPARQPIGFGDGATVVAYAGKTMLRRTVTSASYLSQDSRRVHFGLGGSTKVDKFEVHWLGGKTESWTNLEAGRIWDVMEGDEQAHPFTPATSQAVAPASLGKAELVQFWSKQRAAMDAMKRDDDVPRAARLFREALAINPAHEDSRYYLANCLAAQGDTRGAITELEALARINPMSHRAWQRRGVLLAATATTPAELSLAGDSIQRALSLNPEETGTLLLLGEIALLRGDFKTAERQLQAACHTNPRAVGGFYLRSYISWKQRDRARASELLAAAKKARGAEWKPKGSVAEGDVKRRMDREAGLLASFWEQWEGSHDPAASFAPLDSFLRSRYSLAADKRR